MSELEKRKKKRFQINLKYGKGLVEDLMIESIVDIRNSNVQDGGRNYLWSSIENTNERNIQRIWEATEKPTKSYQWEFWYHHDRNKESSEW